MAAVYRGKIVGMKKRRRKESGCWARQYSVAIGGHIYQQLMQHKEALVPKIQDDSA